MPKILGEIVHSGGDFAILDSSNIRGGFHQVSNLKERDSLISDKKKSGMLVYVASENQIYQWINNTWKIFNADRAGSSVYYTLSQQLDNVLTINNPDDSVKYYGFEFKDSTIFKGGDILGWNITINSDGEIMGSYAEVLYKSGNTVYIEAIDSNLLPSKYDTIYLSGSTSDVNRRLILAIHPYEGGVVLSQFLNNSIDNINTNYTFRLGQHDTNYWKVYGEDVYFKGTFIDTQGRNLSDLVNLNQDTISTGLEGVRRELGYDNMLNNPYFINGMDCWFTENTATYFTLNNKFLMTNRTLFTTKKKGAYVIIEDSQAILKIHEGFITQTNANLKKILDLDNINKPYYVTLIFNYKALSTGTLKVSIVNESKEGYSEGLPIYKIEQSLNSNPVNYSTFKASFLWNGSGDFRLEYLDGEINIQTLVIRVNEVKTFEKKYKELFEYSDVLVQMAKDYLKQTN